MAPPTPILHSVNGTDRNDEDEDTDDVVHNVDPEMEAQRTAKLSDWSRRDLFMRYSRLPDDHPVSRYVQNLFEEASAKMPTNFKNYYFAGVGSD